MLTDSQLDTIGTDMLSFCLGEDSRNLRQFASLYCRRKRWPSQVARKDYIVHCCFIIAKIMLKFRRCKNLILWEEVANDIADVLSQEELEENRLLILVEKAQHLEQNWKVELEKRLTPPVEPPHG